MHLKSFLFLVLSLSITILSCNDGIKITKDYIYNPKWNNSDFEYGRNTVEIVKLSILNDSMLNAYLEKSPFDRRFINFLEVDSSFWFFAYFEKEDITKTVYFNKNYNWKWRIVCSKTKDHFQGKNNLSNIGTLNKNTWYRFSKLKMNQRLYIYVYVDSIGNSHSYRIIKSSNF